MTPDFRQAADQRRRDEWVECPRCRSVMLPLSEYEIQSSEFGGGRHRAMGVFGLGLDGVCLQLRAEPARLRRTKSETGEAEKRHPAKLPRQPHLPPLLPRSESRVHVLS